MTKGCESKALLFIMIVLLLAAGSVYGESAPKKGDAAQGFLGSVKSIDCAKGEITLTGRKGTGEGVFVLGKDAEFRNIKGCEEITAGGVLLVYYTEADGKKIVKSVLLQSKKEAEKKRSPQRAAKSNVFMGWVNSVDCDKGSIALEKLDDRSLVESFSLGKETAIDVGPSNKCAEIQKGSIVVVVFDEKDNTKSAKTIRLMGQGKR